MKGEKVFQFFFVEPRFLDNPPFSNLAQPFLKVVKVIYLAQPFLKVVKIKLKYFS